MRANAKPPYGSPCNNCGQCCRDNLCPLGEHVFERWEGPCPALEEDSLGSRCGLVASPRAYAPVRTSRFGARAMSGAAALLIGAGGGCDAQLEGEAVHPETRLKMREAARAIPMAAIEAAARMWGFAKVPA